jgi:leucyl aminopeptidase
MHNIVFRQRRAFPEQSTGVVMNFSLSNKAITSTSADCLVVGLPEKGNWPESTTQVDNALGGLIKTLQKSGDISGKNASTQAIPLSDQPWGRLLVVGTGDDAERTPAAYRKALVAAVDAVKDGPAKSVLLTLTDTTLTGDSAVTSETARLNLTGRTLEEQLYQFTGFKSKKPDARKLNKVIVAATDASQALKDAFNLGLATGRGMNFTRDLGNTPPNVCHPEWLAQQAKDLAKEYGNIKTEILDEKQMAKMGMNTILAVGKGSTRPPRLIVMEYRGGKEGDKPHALVGKGITFDSGGISLKPGAAMDEMKYDMGGAASVLGVMHTVAALNLPINVIGILAGCENMPDANAYRPGDILTTMSGQTVEVMNTDAEGRLVLCDALTFVERYEPDCVVDIATLTGACIVALGHHATGLMSTHNPLAHELLNASEQSSDRAWRLPLWDEYQSQIDSPFADISNLGVKGAGTITAACFLSRFTKKYNWAHMDIAGTAWNSGANKGSTGRPVSMLAQFLMNRAGVVTED